MKAEIAELENDFSAHTLDQLVKQSYSAPPSGKNGHDQVEDFGSVLEREKEIALGQSSDSNKVSTLSLPENVVSE